MSGSGSVSDYGGPVAIRPTSLPLQPGTAANRYNTLEGIRMPYQFRAIRQASLTLPNLFRIIGANGTTDEITAWQSYGAECVNSLVSKLLLTIFPPDVPFIKLNPTKDTLKDLQKLPPDQRAMIKQAIDKGLAEAEQEFAQGVSEDGDSAMIALCIKNLIVGGNYCIQFYKDGTCRGIPFIHWVCQRDKQGNLIEFCIRDQLVRDSLPEDIKGMLAQKDPIAFKGETLNPGAGQSEVMVFTYGRWMGNKWTVYQECEGYVVPQTEWTYTREALPFMFIPFSLLDGEHYGRSYCEDFEGDFQTLDGLEQSITEGTAAAARFITLVKPGGVTNKRILAEAQNGDVITGDADEVHTLEANKNEDFQAGINRIEAKEERLGKAFLLADQVRDAERVTAEEIQLYTKQLQDALGGLYTMLVPNLQAPYATLKMAGLQRNGRMVYLPKDSVKRSLVTGAAALGRAQAAQNLDALIAGPQASQQAAATVIKWPAWFERKAVALGVDSDGLVTTQEELDEQQQNMQRSAALQQTAPDLVRAGGSLLQEGMKQRGAMTLQQAEQQQPQPQQQQTPPQPQQQQQQPQGNPPQ